LYILFDKCKLELLLKLDVQHSSEFAGSIGAVFLDTLKCDANNIDDNGDIDEFLGRILTTLNEERK